MQDLDNIRAKLKDFNIQAVAESTGLHPNSIYRFMTNKDSDPRYNTVLKLIKYLEKS